jgi:hypothetical protein
MNESFIDQRIFILICLILSVIRIYLEVVGFNFANLPISKKLPSEQVKSFHKYGLYMSIGYFILFAPGFLLS